MARRKHISWKTKCAAALLDGMLVRERFGLYPRRWYDDAKRMTEDQFLSLFQFDHNILHETEHPDRDKFWNQTPRLIAEHRSKTKQDAKVIAKGRRLRENPLVLMAEVVSAGLAEGARHAYERVNSPSDTAYRDGWDRIWGKRKIRSRGFDKTRRRKMDGTVVKL